MGVDLEVMVTSQKRRVTLPSGEKVTVFGYRTCPRGESRPSSWLHECQDAQDAIVERARDGVRNNQPRYIVGLGFGERERWGGKTRRVFDWKDGLRVYEVIENHNCPVSWWDTDAPPNTKLIGFLKKEGRRWVVTLRYESECRSTGWDLQGNPVHRNRFVEYIDENGKYQHFGYWKDEASESQAPSRLVAV